MLVVAVAVIAAPAARSDEQPALAGLYLCEGTDPTGSQYRGFVEIAGHRSTLVLTWIFPESPESGAALRPSAVGVGIARGGSLAVSYFSGTMAGIIVYRIQQENRQLLGEWTVVGGDGSVYSETLTRLGVPVSPSLDDDEPREGQKRKVPAVRGGVAL
jgi:hypothetical protein